MPPRPWLEELAVYATLTISTLNLALASLLHDRVEVFKAYLGYTLVVWSYLLYAVFDCFNVWSTGSRYIPTDGCCPNQNVPQMNIAMYFGGTSLFLAPSAVILAFQTVQVFVAGGAYVSAKESVWPGNGWGYSLACLLATVYFARFSGPLEAPCPSGAFGTLFGLETNDGVVFAIFGFALILLILLDGLTPVTFYARLFGAAIVSLFCASIAYASDGRGMLTLQLLLLLFKAWWPPVWGAIETLWSAPTPVPAPERQQRMRWVMPVSTKLPVPLVMTDPPPAPAAVRDHKKRY